MCIKVDTDWVVNEKPNLQDLFVEGLYDGSPPIAL